MNRLNILLPYITTLVLYIAADASAVTANVAVVVGKQAPALERFAAHELCDYLKKVFDIEATLATSLNKQYQLVLVIGNPQTNTSVSAVLGDNPWPPLTHQGIALLPGGMGKVPVLVVGGGSPQATLWAVYELVERWGVRYLLQGDILPELSRLTADLQPKEITAAFRLPAQNIVLEPNLPVRAWRVINDFPMGPEGWGMDDYRPVLNQLAKLKFNRIVLATYPWQPFLNLKFRGITHRSAALWFNWHYPITDDMPGRQLFGNEPEFWNPDLPSSASYDEFVAAAQQLVHNLMQHAHQRGMECVMSATLLEYPPEFATALPDTLPIHQLAALNVVPGPQVDVNNETMAELATTVVQTTINTYPEIDRLQINNVEFRQWTSSYKACWQTLDQKYKLSSVRKLEDILPDPESDHRDVVELKGDIVGLYLYDRLFQERQILKGTKRPQIPLTYKSISPSLFPVLPLIFPPNSGLLVGAYTASAVDRPDDALRSLPTDKIEASIYFTLHDDNVGFIPQLTTGSLHQLATQLRKDGWAGFTTRYWLIGDHEYCVAYLARSSWDGSSTPESVYRDYIQHACGGDCVDDMLELLRELEAVTVNLEARAQGVFFPIPEMLMRQWDPRPMPTHLAEARDGYRRALAAARRAREQAGESGKRYVDYWVGRLKFGIGMLDTVETVRLAAIAEENEQLMQAYRHCLTALESARSAIESYAEIAWNQSDRGTIAMLAEYVYRPLKTKAGELQNQAK